MRASRRSGAASRKLRLVKPLFRRAARASDQLEAAIVVVVALLAIASVAVVGTLSVADYGRMESAVATQVHSRRLVIADVHPGSPVHVAAGGGSRGPSLTAVAATWSTPSGHLQRGVVEVATGSALPRHVQIWTDQSGRQVAPPLTGVEVFITAVLGGVLWESIALVALGGCYLLGRRILDRRRAQQWERAWSRWRGAPTP
ncbi:Rv1733c family protein [Amycolatopsis nalaikhensis]|uniref:Transmembrane protein n=1 Tax=Amycolatopsis nalaikhensis TaxID=715472 RepID=A0ABY8XUE6_9PSEU|nr:hypothetical protein [Amycolatopsis sp. 2-2]WIV59208.1 hypothetical protein QP939_11550 [Amycolatopsis sp. 2-2]